MRGHVSQLFFPLVTLKDFIDYYCFFIKFTDSLKYVVIGKIKEVGSVVENLGQHPDN